MRLLWFILICLTIAIGGYFACSPKYEVMPSYYRAHLRAIRIQLEDIKTHLQRFKKKKGKYPTNDEGLLALEELKTQLNLDGEKTYEVLENRRSAQLRLRNRPYEPVSEAGILSPWDVPYVYENREGFNEGIFSESPATIDTGRNYSIKVDENVFVYSVGAMIYYRDYVSVVREMYFVRLFTLSLLVLFIVLFFKSKRAQKPQSAGTKSAKALGAAAAVITSILVAWAPHSATCYAIAFFSKWRRPEMLSRYTQLLEKYESRGVISGEVAAKIKGALRDELSED